MEMIKNGLRYDVYSDHIIVLGFSKNRKPGGILKIPHSVYNKPVTEIANEAFVGSSIEEIQIPTTLKKIGYMAFCHCTSLKKFYTSERRYIPMSQTLVIDSKAFAFCKQLESVDTTQELIIGSYAFFNCYKLNKFYSTVAALYKHAICGCKDLYALAFSEKASLAEECFLKSNINLVKFCVNADIHPEALSFMRLKDVQIVVNHNSPLLDLAYEGYRIL